MREIVLCGLEAVIAWVRGWPSAAPRQMSFDTARSINRRVWMTIALCLYEAFRTTYRPSATCRASATVDRKMWSSLCVHEKAPKGLRDYLRCVLERYERTCGPTSSSSVPCAKSAAASAAVSGAFEVPCHHFCRHPDLLFFGTPGR